MLEFSEVPDELKVVNQAERVHGADFELGLVKWIRDVVVTGRIQVKDEGLCAADERGVERKVLGNGRVYIWEATRPIYGRNNAGLMGHLLAERFNSIAMLGYTGEMRSYFNKFLGGVAQFGMRQTIARRTYPNALIHAKPSGDFAMVARTRGPGIAQRQEARDGIVIYSASAVPRQNFFKANNARRRKRHVSSVWQTRNGTSDGDRSQLVTQLKYSHTDTGSVGHSAHLDAVFGDRLRTARIFSWEEELI